MTTSGKIKQLFMFCCTSYVLSACVKSFVPDVEKYSELLVVDGNIHSGPGPYTVKLSKSSRLQELSKYKPYANCVVQITDDAGTNVHLSEKAPGVYQTDSSEITGIPGRVYKLRVLTTDGEWIESIPELMPLPIKIESVYGELQHKTDPKYFYGKDGFQFYVNAETPEKRENYLFWRMQATYKFKVDFSIDSYYDNYKLHQVIWSDSLKLCYRTVDNLDLFLLNTGEQQFSELKRIPLNYEDNYTRALTIRYSLNVTQLTISKSAFEYWRTIKKIRDESGELYTQQPFQVKNNLRNVNEPDKPVLGYFMVAGSSEKRIFLDPPPIVFRYDTCRRVGTSVGKALAWLPYRPEMWPVFFADFGYMQEQECLNCLKLGTQNRPAFWKD